MMRTLLVPLGQVLVSEPALEAAFFLAKRMNSHIRAMYVRPDPEAPIAYVPVEALAEMREAIIRRGREAAVAEKIRVDAWRARHEIADAPDDGRLDSCFATWTEQLGEIDRVVTHFGRVSDMIVVSRFRPNEIEAEHCFDAAVFGTGRPTLVVPEKLPWDLLDHVMIAWNGSLEASHAVFGAMPLLHAAGRVSIFSTPEPDSEGVVGRELAEALSWYGISAHQVSGPREVTSVGRALLATAASCEATLVVMGAYTHSRLRQGFLGGVTRHVLSQGTVPLLMSH